MFMLSCTGCRRNATNQWVLDFRARVLSLDRWREFTYSTVTVGKILLKIGQREQLYCMIGCKKRVGIRSSNLLKDELYLISVRLLRCHETLNWFKAGLLYWIVKFHWARKMWMSRFWWEHFRLDTALVFTSSNWASWIHPFWNSPPRNSLPTSLGSGWAWKTSFVSVNMQLAVQARNGHHLDQLFLTWNAVRWSETRHCVLQKSTEIQGF